MSGSLDFDSFEGLTEVGQDDIDNTVVCESDIGEIKQVENRQGSEQTRLDEEIALARFE